MVTISAELVLHDNSWLSFFGVCSVVCLSKHSFLIGIVVILASIPWIRPRPWYRSEKKYDTWPVELSYQVCCKWSRIPSALRYCAESIFWIVSGLGLHTYVALTCAAILSISDMWLSISAEVSRVLGLKLPIYFTYMLFRSFAAMIDVIGLFYVHLR